MTDLEDNQPAVQDSMVVPGESEGDVKSHNHINNDNTNNNNNNNNNINENNTQEITTTINTTSSSKKRNKRRKKKKKKKRNNNNKNNDKYEEPMSLQRPCIAVPDAPPGWEPDLTQEAETPEEYLQRVRWEAQHQCPTVTVASHIDPDAYDENRTEHRLLARFRRQTRHLHQDNDIYTNNNNNKNDNQEKNVNDNKNLSSTTSTTSLQSERPYRAHPSWTRGFLKDFAAKRRWMCTAAHALRHGEDADVSTPPRGDWEGWHKYCWGDSSRGVLPTPPSLAVLLSMEYQTVNQLFEQHVRWIVEDNPLLFKQQPAARSDGVSKGSDGAAAVNGSETCTDENKDDEESKREKTRNENGKTGEEIREEARGEEEEEEEESELGVSDIISESNEEQEDDHDGRKDHLNTEDGDDVSMEENNDDVGDEGVTENNKIMFSWIYGLMLRIERPLQPSVSAALADLVKWCTKKRSGIVRSAAIREESRRDGVAHLNMLLAMTLYFGQAAPHNM